MKLDLRHPLNEGIVHRRSARRNIPAVTLPREHPDPYYTLGSHPDVVEFIWDTLGKQMPKDCRAVVYGTPGLVHPVAGVVLVLAYGTTYALRVPSARFESAESAGYETARDWSNGEHTDLSSELGRGWYFGKFSSEPESRWLTELYSELLERT